jgi:hypothetical protein
MRRLKAQCLLQVSLQVGQGLTGYREDQIHIEILKPCLSDNPQRFACLIGGVDTTKELEEMGLKGLCADADAIHA